MDHVGKAEPVTQNRIIALFQDELNYSYLGDWTYRTGFEGKGNSNIEEELLTNYLTRRGYHSAQINKVFDRLRTEANNHNRTLYANNQAVYKLLRYGIPVKVVADEVTESINLIDWQQPENNDFAIAEEVTLKGNHERRPDLVL